MDVGGAVGGLELNEGSRILTVAAGKKVLFYDIDTFEKVKEFDIPCTVYSASMHCDRKIFVCGGDDFKLYKYDYESGAEIGECN
jgi:serine-threonine kinase receptor-associated protein